MPAVPNMTLGKTGILVFEADLGAAGWLVSDTTGRRERPTPGRTTGKRRDRQPGRRRRASRSYSTPAASRTAGASRLRRQRLGRRADRARRAHRRLRPHPAAHRPVRPALPAPDRAARAANEQPDSAPWSRSLDGSEVDERSTARSNASRRAIGLPIVPRQQQGLPRRLISRLAAWTG